MIIHCTIFHTINTDIFEYKFYQFYNMFFFCIKTESKKKKIPTKYINEIIMKFLCKKFHPKRWMIYIVCLGGMKHPYRFNLGSDIWDQLLKHQEAFHWRERNSFFLAKYSSNLMIAYLKHKFEKKILLIHAFRTEIKDFRPKQW